MNEKNINNEFCQVHTDQRVTARCVRFNRRFCDKDFEPDADPPADCLSRGTYCEFRPQCVVWEKLREIKKQERERSQAEAQSSA